jgi:hypothetical protein
MLNRTLTLAADQQRDFAGARVLNGSILLKNPLAIHIGQNVGNIVPIFDKLEE